MKLNNFLEKLDKDSDMGDYIKDFYKSDAPQFKGKSKKKRRQMAIAAKLSANESLDEGPMDLINNISNMSPEQFRQMLINLGMEPDAINKIINVAIEAGWENVKADPVAFANSLRQQNPQVFYGLAGVLGLAAVGGGFIVAKVGQGLKKLFTGKKSNESLQALARHVKEGVPLPDSLFRYQSEAYFDTFKKAKQLREMGSLPELDWESEEMLSTDIGESVVLENGEVVWLDVPYLYEEADEYECPECGGSGLDMDDPTKDCAYCGGDGLVDSPEMYYAKGMTAPKPIRPIRKIDDKKYIQMYRKLYDTYVKPGKVPYAKLPALIDDYIESLIKKKVLTADDRLDPAERLAIFSKFVDTIDEGKSPHKKGTKKYKKHMAAMHAGESVTNEAEYNDAYDNENELEVAKILGNALKKKDWYQFSPQELFSELESVNVDLADLINRIAKINYGVRLQENKQINEVAPLVAMAGWAVLRTAATQGLKWTAKQALKRPITTGLTADLALNDGKVTSEVIDKVTDVINDNIEDPLPDLTPDFLEPFIGKPWATAGLLAAFFIGAGALRLWLDKRKDVIDNEEAEKLIDLRNLAGQKAKEMTATNEGTRCWKGYKKKGMKTMFGKRVPNCVKNESEINEGEERSIIRDACVDRLVDEFRGEEHQFENLGDLEYAIYSEMERMDVEDCVDPDMEVGGQRIGDFASGGVINVIDSSSAIEDVVAQLDTSDLKEGRSSELKLQIIKALGEAEYKGKKVQLNKPKRGGSKKYYVYVKNPKTDRVKKISFGDVTGLRTKSGNKKRAKSFAARHNCEKKNDKMKAGYWACRLPRYGLVKGGKWW